MLTCQPRRLCRLFERGPAMKEVVAVERVGEEMDVSFGRSPSPWTSWTVRTTVRVISAFNTEHTSDDDKSAVACSARTHFTPAPTQPVISGL